jgi:hypothetical protein
VGDCDFRPLFLGWPVVMELGSDDRATTTPSELLAELVVQLGLGWKLVWL